jgi:serine/threonine protein kinase/tetratricopeptide (TPR) repeat protein
MSDRMEQAKSIFLEAIDRHAPEQWPAFLEHACGGDGALRAEVEKLLRAQVEIGSFHGQSRVPAAVTTDQPIQEIPGTIIGPYKLLEPIGEGGMGAVWMVQQTEPVKRVVALKLIKAGMDSRQVIARFETERQALALMDHPNIAHVLDAGTTSAGRPYFVMDLVKGVPITRHCDEHRLTPRQRLELFVPVCQAIQHAHQKGIIHRDLKPSNVLIALYDGKPVPKVIDFGVAKATGQSLTDKTLVTGFGNIVGTLEYMSPEQAEINQLDIDTRSDIYSLGVVLYELLTGSPPFTRKELEKAGMLEMLRVIREQEPSKPSTKLSTAEGLPTLAANRGTEPAKLTKLLRGELDWIVMKALEKDRCRRYETANGFAMDVQRYLADEAVLACPPSMGYRLRKFVRRNRPQVIAAAAVLVTLPVGMAGTTYGLVRAEHRRQEAMAGKKKAENAEMEALAAYRDSTDDAIIRLIGSKTELGLQEKLYVENTLKRWQAFAARQGDDEHSQSIRAEGHYWVAVLWQKLGRREEARAQYEMAHGLLKKLADAFPNVPRYQQLLARTHGNVGLLLKELGQYEAARTDFETGLNLLRQLTTAFPDPPDYQYELAQVHHNLGLLLADLGQDQEARTEYETARDLYKKLADAFSDVPDYRWGLGSLHNSLGVFLAKAGHRDAARAAYETARDLLKKLADAFPDVPQFQQLLGEVHNNLAMTLDDLGQYEAAHAEHETASTVQEKLIASFPSVIQYRIELGGSYCNLGNLFRDHGHPADSLPWYDRAVRTLTPIYEKDRRDVMAKEFLRNGHWGRAIVCGRLQQHAEAVKDWDRAIELSPGPEQPSFRVSRAVARLEAGQVADAVAEVEDLTKRSKWSTDDWYNFACVYAVASGKVADKKPEYADRAVELLRQAVNAGYRNATHMGTDTDLDPLREREDFKRLLAELETKTK